MLVRICVQRPQLSEAVLDTFKERFPNYDRLSSARHPTVEYLEFTIEDKDAGEFQRIHRTLQNRGGKATFLTQKTMVPDTDPGASL